MLKSLFIKHGRVIKYVISGGTAAAVNIATYNLLLHIFGVNYLWAQVVGFILSFGFSFILQKYWTFQDGGTENIHRQAFVYLLVSLINFFVGLLLLYVFVDYLYVFLTFISLPLWKTLAQVIVNALIAFVSFFIYRKIFKTQ
jgi:putative flippase GtrA